MNNNYVSEIEGIQIAKRFNLDFFEISTFTGKNI